jgi:hypothetical protein
MKRTKDRFKTFKITPCSSSHQHISSSSRSSSTSLFLSLALDSVFPEIQDKPKSKTFHSSKPTTHKTFKTEALERIHQACLLDCFATDHPEQQASAFGLLY